ncbi:penicillin acylase family protein [Eleftheria terrae]|uniref:penicillin acylase family protein n=1 Tax=Eleftheria terrae TaxID=1597781 RepID=UPI00263A61EB|nr:penicillin acylase family protein [Eleftheria terrae]WKB53520.1 penicillin acylase family protein [Eleftheria terrae]
MRRVLWAIVALVVLVIGGLWLYIHRALPQQEGVVAVPRQALKAPVRITRDAHGIPTIEGETMADVMWGLGFVHAQDRLWQLELHRRIGAGRLAEAFGETALGTDIFLRSLGVRRVAQQQLQSVSGEGREALEAYAAGVNAYVSQHLKARPPEFLLLGLQPGRWEPADSLAWMTMMAWDLGANWNNELLRLRLALKLPLERINQLLPPYRGEAPLPTTDYTELFRSLKVDAGLGEQAQRFAPESGIEGVGSNNWVVAGSHTTSGRPLLANDPHLRLSAPALWYFARLQAPGWKVAGATMPGVPAVVLGQNEHIAWGYTNTGPDVQDLYLEQLHPDDPQQYLTPTGWARFDTHEEQIAVKGGMPRTITVRSSRHGPVISDAPGAAEGLTGPPARPAFALAMRWTALDVPNTTFEAGLAMNRARTVDEFVAASARHLAPMQNMVVADVSGRIGMVAAGRVPVRGARHDLRGLVPAPGWDAKYDWTGYLDASLTPREFDPPRGWIATANQRIHPPDYPHFLTSEWTAPYRAERIEQLLGEPGRHDVDSMAALQADEVSLAARQLLPLLLQARSSHPLAARVRALLQRFDGRMAADRAEPLILWAWTRQATELMVADELGPALWTQYRTRSFYDAVERMLLDRQAWWCDNKTTPAVETCQQLMDSALDRALDELQAAYGADPQRWQWGQAHQARSEHRPFSKVKSLARWFELRVPVGGDTHTVNASRVGLREDELTGRFYLNEHGPSLRAIYDLGTPGQSRFMQSTGQSGLPFSRAYRSFLQPWAEGQYVPLWAAEAGPTLVLQPR